LQGLAKNVAGHGSVWKFSLFSSDGSPGN
jgi:hypothetical protein